MLTDILQPVKRKKYFWHNKEFYGWVLSNAVIFSDPVPMKGNQGLWRPKQKDIEDEILKLYNSNK